MYFFQKLDSYMYITSGSFKNLCENKQKSEVSIDTNGYMRHFQRIDKVNMQNKKC